MTKTLNTIADLTPDDMNANAGTERGRYMVAHSLETYGAGRSILADKNGKIIAGNKTLESAAEKDFPIRVVQTDGRELVVVQRTDLDLNDPAARELAIADNRASEVGLLWSPTVLAGMVEQGANLSGMFHPEEMATLLETAADEVLGDEPPKPTQVCTCPECGYSFTP